MISNEEYNQFRKIALKICSSDERTEDLLHDVIIQLSRNEKFLEMTGKSRTYFFVKAVSNQFYSNNSYFYRTYRKNTPNELPQIIREIPEEEYYDKPSLDWVRKELDKQLEKDKDFWYDKGIFELYLKHKKLETIHNLTQIPKYSLRDTIAKMKKWLKKKWNDGQIG